ncbi:MAG: class I SAM-dependent methyltransferase, partial [Bacteroidota bacterium]
MLRTLVLPASIIFSLSLLLLSSCESSQSGGPVIPPLEGEDRYKFKERSIWQKPGVVFDAMGDLEEKVVADIGAGDGFFAHRLARLADRVIAVEIDDHWVKYINDTLRFTELGEEFRPRLVARLTAPDDPGLEENEVDVVLIVNTFLEIEGKEAYLKRLYPTLKEGGKIVIVDWKKKQTGFGPEQSRRIPLFELEKMLQ